MCFGGLTVQDRCTPITAFSFSLLIKNYHETWNDIMCGFLVAVYSLCPLPPVVSNATGNTVHDNLNGNYIEYTCIKGSYIGHGDSRLKCSNGTISGILPTCLSK